ncbi:hypothetical protein QTI17_31325 [Variovorax sp. J31P179]|uniref:hypothetical protein n=1 Tax=Variovorax sp. J31P179 TaxID=3053508 RepID=UPI002576C716|nr:hypothetical protein [Variovorax sp. J31P179]MDM0085087.1 hypothetical protein [Variovorax sp. J31P179]
MRPRLLRTRLQRRLRLALHVAPVTSWRPLLLRWPRSTRRPETEIARVSAHAVHRHHSLVLHLHYAAATAPGTPRVAAATSRPTAAPLIGRSTAVKHTDRRELALHHMRIHDTHLYRQWTGFSILRSERVQLIGTARTESTYTDRSVLMPAAPSPTAVPGRDAATSTARRPGRAAIALPTLIVRAPAPEQAVLDRSRRPSTVAPLVWRVALPEAVTVTDATAGTDISVPASTAAPATAFARAAPPVAAPVTASQAREAVRANLLDPAIADRLADDVIRRVEKRLRIERERRGI